MKQKLVLFFLLLTSSLLSAQGNIQEYPGGPITSGIYEVTSSKTINQDIGISKNATLIIRKGVDLKTVGAATVDGKLIVEDGAGIYFTGGMTVGGHGAGYSTIVELGVKSYLTITGSLTLRDAAFGQTPPVNKALFQMDTSSMVEICAAFQMDGSSWPAVEYIGSPTEKAYFVTKSTVAGNSSRIADQTQVQWIAIGDGASASLQAGDAQHCGGNATPETCSIWLPSLGEDWQNCNKAQDAVESLPDGEEGYEDCITCVAGTDQVYLLKSGLSNNQNIVPIGSSLFFEDFGTSDYSVDRGRKASPYMPSESYEFGSSFQGTGMPANPGAIDGTNPELNKARINDGYYAVVAPGYIKRGWYLNENGAQINDAWGYWWTPAFDEPNTVTDFSGKTDGAAMVINAGDNFNPFYNRTALVELGATYEASFQMYLVNKPGQVAVDILRLDGTIIKSFNSGVLGENHETQWNSMEIEFTIPGAVSDCQTSSQEVIISLRNQDNTHLGNDWYIDNIMVEKLADAPLCSICVSHNIDYVNLNDAIDQSEIPQGTDVVWFADALATQPVVNPEEVKLSGTYYAFYYDNVGDCYNTIQSTASVTVTIYDPCPVLAKDDINQIPEGTTATGNVLDNDTGTNPKVTKFVYLDQNGAEQSLPKGSTVSVYDSLGEEAGEFTLNVDGTYTFNPKSGFIGDVPLKYEIIDDTGQKDSAHLDIKVIPNYKLDDNNPPVAHPDYAEVKQGDSVTVDPLGNDHDPDGDTLTVEEITYNGTPISTDSSNPTTIPGKGTAYQDANGKLVFEADPNFDGDVDFEYTISDGKGGEDSSTITVTVTEDEPVSITSAIVANDDTNSGPKNENQTGDVKENDTWGGTNAKVTGILADGVSVPVGVRTEIPGKGHITLNADGTYTFEPAENYVGTLAVTYTVTNDEGDSDTAKLYLTTLDVEAKAPIAKDDINQIPEGENATGNVLDNDTGLNVEVTEITYLDSSGNPQTTTPGTTVTVHDKDGNIAGVLTLNTNGTYTFVPETGFTGDVPLEYEITDILGQKDTAHLDIKVIPELKDNANNPPVAHPDYAEVQEGEQLSLNPLHNDNHPDRVAISVKEIHYNNTPISTDSSTPTVIPGKGTAYQDPNTGELVFIANPGVTGDVVFDYTIEDVNGEEDTSTITISITEDAPISTNSNLLANDDTNSAPQGEDMTGDISTNDTWGGTNSKVDEATAVYNGTEYPLNLGASTDIPGVGEITLNPNGTYTFVPEADFIGTLPVHYTAKNDEADEDTAILYLTSIPYVDRPEIEITKSGAYVDANGDGDVNIGDTIEYTFVVKNTGNVTLTDVIITDPLVTVNGSLASLAPGASDATTFTATYTITQDDLDAGGVYNKAIATGKDPNADDISATSKDPNPLDPSDPNYDENCKDCTYTDLPNADLSILKTADKSELIAGETIVFTLTVTNNGPSTAKDVEVFDLLPSGYTYLSDNSSGAYTSATGKWLIGDMAKAETRTIEITAKVNNAGIYKNVAVVEATTTDLDLTNNTSEYEPAIERKADLYTEIDFTIEGVSNPTSAVKPGDAVEFKVTVGNKEMAGDMPSADVEGAKFAFHVPTGVTIVGTPTASTSCANEQVPLSYDTDKKAWVAELDIPADCSIEYTFEGVLNGVSGAMIPEASVLRPNGVIDIDATNQFGEEPTNPHYECYTDPNGGLISCNNITEVSFLVLDDCVEEVLYYEDFGRGFWEQNDGRLPWSQENSISVSGNQIQTDINGNVLRNGVTGGATAVYQFAPGMNDPLYGLASIGHPVDASVARIKNGYYAVMPPGYVQNGIPTTDDWKTGAWDPDPNVSHDPNDPNSNYDWTAAWNKPNATRDVSGAVNGSAYLVRGNNAGNNSVKPFYEINLTAPVVQSKTYTLSMYSFVTYHHKDYMLMDVVDADTGHIYASVPMVYPGHDRNNPGATIWPEGYSYQGEKVSFGWIKLEGSFSFNEAICDVLNEDVNIKVLIRGSKDPELSIDGGFGHTLIDNIMFTSRSMDASCSVPEAEITCSDDCYGVINGSWYKWRYEDGDKTNNTFITEEFNQPSSDGGFVLDIYQLDNSFNMKINGTDLFDEQIEFQTGDAWVGGSTGPILASNIRFKSDKKVWIERRFQVNPTPDQPDAIWQINPVGAFPGYEGQGPYPTGFDWENTPANELPMPAIRLMIDRWGNTKIYGARKNNWPLEELELFDRANPNQVLSFNQVIWKENPTEINEILVTQEVIGATAMVVHGYGQSYKECETCELEKDGEWNDLSGDDWAQVGETITYTFKVINKGDMNLHDVEITDPLFGSSIKVNQDGSLVTSLQNLIFEGDFTNKGILDRNETWTFTVDYTITNADIFTNKGVYNRAKVTGTGVMPISGTESLFEVDSFDPTPYDDTWEGWDPARPFHTYVPLKGQSIMLTNPHIIQRTK